MTLGINRQDKKEFPAITARFRNLYICPQMASEKLCYRGLNADQWSIAIMIWGHTFSPSLSFALLVPCRKATIKMENLMGLGWDTWLQPGRNFYVPLSVPRLICDWYIHRRISAVFKDRHSECSIYRDRSLFHLLILRVMQSRFRFPEEK